MKNSKVDKFKELLAESKLLIDLGYTRCRKVLSTKANKYIGFF